jgi:hypothetical protein
VHFFLEDVNSLQNLNLTSLDFDINKINQMLTDQHSKVILDKLQHLSTQEHDNKLFFFANLQIYFRK